MTLSVELRDRGPVQCFAAWFWQGHGDDLRRSESYRHKFLFCRILSTDFRAIGWIDGPGVDLVILDRGFGLGRESRRLLGRGIGDPLALLL